MRESISIAGRYAGTLRRWSRDVARRFEKHPIRFTAAFSVTVHAILLLIGYSPYRPYVLGEFDSFPTLQLTVAFSDGPDDRNENPPATERLVQSGPPHVPASAPVDEQPTEIDPAGEAAKSEPPPPPPNDEPGSAMPAEAVVAEAGASEPAEIVTTSGFSERSEPAIDVTTAIPQPTVAVSIPADQQDDIARKVLRWAQGLKDIDDASSQLLWQQDGREYTAVLKRRPAGSSSEYDGATVEISTIEHGQRMRTSLNLRRLAFSHFTQFVDEWDSNVQLHDDEIIGRFHSNSRLTIGYLRTTPRFYGKVTTAAHDYSMGTWSRFKPRSEIFQGGFEAGAGRINLPRQFIQFGSNPAMSDARIHSFDRHTRIAFYSDGTYGWQPMESGTVEEREPVGSDPLLIVGAPDVELHVRGVVKGTVLVYSRERIWVDDDLTYATNPKMVPESQDYTGLVSDKFIDVAGPEMTGPGDLSIDAAIYARRGFTVRNEYARGRTRSTLRIYGSLTAGTLSATEPRYATRLEFDPRLERKRPPGFPMTNRYEVEQWDGQWIVH
jgi:hypothetical protein